MESFSKTEIAILKDKCTCIVRFAHWLSEPGVSSPGRNEAALRRPVLLTIP